MPKQKTNRSVAKRFKLSGGKAKTVLRRKAGKSHLLTGKTRKRKRSLRRAASVSRIDAKDVRKQLPYG